MKHQDQMQAAAGSAEPRLLNITRRAALERLSAGLLLAMGLWPGAGAARGESTSSRFRFIVVNDLHYMSPECGAWLEGVVRQMKQEQPEFCLAAGDLTEHGQREHLAAIRDILQGLGVPAYVQIGNHDYLEGSAGFTAPPATRPVYAPSDARQQRQRPVRGVQTSSFSPGDRRFYEEIFPGRLNYWFEHRGWQFVGLDSTEGLFYERTEIQPSTFQWLDVRLRKLETAKPTVIFTHFPLGAGVRYRPSNADDLLDRFRPFNLQVVFCGHFHGFTERQMGQTTLTTNKCCALKRGNHDGTREKGYFVCTAADGRLTRRFVECKVPTKG